MMLARSLKMDVVAEGVETIDQLTQLAMLECEYGQGYYFSKPLSIAGAAKLLADGQTYPITLPALDSFTPERSALVA